MAIVSNDPTDESKEQFPKWRMDVEEICALKIVRGKLGRYVRVCQKRVRNRDSVYLSKMNLIEDDLVGMADAKESSDESKDGNDGQSQLVIPFVWLTLFGLDESLVQGFV